MDSENIEKTEANNPKDKDKNIWLEIIRFVLTGVVCTLVDFFVTFAMMRWIFPEGFVTDHPYLAWGISTFAGFIISTIFNFIFSRLFVFKNTNVKTNTVGYFLFYTGLSLVGFFIGLGVHELGVFIVRSSTDINISYDITQVSMSDLFSKEGLAFWLFALIFGVKTLVVLVWNYLSRKFFIFRAPKEEPNNNQSL